MATSDKTGMVEAILDIVAELAFFDQFEPHELDVISRHLSHRDIKKEEVAFDMVLENHPKIGVKLLSGVARLFSLYLRQASGRLADKLAT